MLHTAGVAGILRPACPRCGRVVRIDKPLDGQQQLGVGSPGTFLVSRSGWSSRGVSSGGSGAGWEWLPVLLSRTPGRPLTASRWGRRIMRRHPTGVDAVTRPKGGSAVLVSPHEVVRYSCHPILVGCMISSH